MFITLSNKKTDALELVTFTLATTQLVGAVVFFVQWLRPL